MTLEEQIEALHKAQMHYENDCHKEVNMTNYTPVEKEYASKSVAGTALGFGLGGTVLSLLGTEVSTTCSGTAAAATSLSS